MSVLFCLRVFALLSAMYLAQRLHRYLWPLLMMILKLHSISNCVIKLPYFIKSIFFCLKVGDVWTSEGGIEN